MYISTTGSPHKHGHYVIILNILSHRMRERNYLKIVKVYNNEVMKWKSSTYIKIYIFRVLNTQVAIRVDKVRKYIYYFVPFE